METLRNSDPSANLSVRPVATPSAAPLWIFRGILYYLSLIGPVLATYSIRHWPIAALLAAAIIGYAFAGFLFLSLLILIKRLVVGSVRPSGWTTPETEDYK